MNLNVHDMRHSWTGPRPYPAVAANTFPPASIKHAMIGKP
jgi:hypothetical protein